MQTWIALFRGINVGGKNRLPMAELRSDLESLNLKNIRTYVQSGNVVFNSRHRTPATLSRKIEIRIGQQHGFVPRVLVLRDEDLLAAIESNPFPQALSDPKSLHFFFLKEPADCPNRTKLDESKSANEQFELVNQVFYLYAPDGIARSKLAANAEKYLKVTATARNYRTVDKLHGMVNDR